MNIEVSLSPALYPFRTLTQHHTTVAIDLLRATTAVCAAFQAGCSSLVPLNSLDELPHYRSMGYQIAAERGGSKVGDAEYGNSPTEYLRHDMKGKRLAYSTTNGTISILRAADAELTLVGSFANISALCDRLKADGRDVVILCSGWQNDFCIEDTLVAGAIIPKLTQEKLVAIEIPVPPLWLQQEIVSILDDLNDKCNTLQDNYQKTLSLCNDLKQSLLREAFYGEL